MKNIEIALEELKHIETDASTISIPVFRVNESAQERIYPSNFYIIEFIKAYGTYVLNFNEN